MKTFENIIFLLKKYWSKKKCIVIQPYDLEIGAGTLHPITFFRGINKEKTNFVYVQPCRRPNDSKPYKNFYKRFYYFQLQVIIKPVPENIQYLYIESLKYIGINLKLNNIDFLEDNWENPTLSAWGIGWEIHINGLEVSQFTYFQQIGGINCNPIMIEITYGLERLSLIIQKKNNISDILWSKNNNLKYGNIFDSYEKEFSIYNLKLFNKKFLFNIFNEYKKNINALFLLKKKLILPTYEYILKLIHIFNMIDAKYFFSIFEKKSNIIYIQNLSKKIANIYYKSINKYDKK
ncbi:glycine--tRNA ligase alpha subunit [endosymbiont of Euscepes postfasciatus]|uniref:glycine--tRNA ligase subunit alpha n=1 Tax=endosymbiont of Euscepes postfasciatus TaxID=650377 RepID=UPI000DC71700|nr:glycine--tRNA ligase subunit alpha [endosymbiont of Euscepes postfasciatus]BBA84738.1 glycine--tRNA ligase alpha subunit [endosymbiont of Euscepes postfasciatus]